MSETFGDFEHLLKRALTPVDPPADLNMRLESTLTELTELAQDELESWELSTMRDPRNWVRPVAAAAIGTTAGAALVLLRVRQQHRRRAAKASGPIDLAERTLHAVADETRKILDR
ncbi:hypothetical protein DSM104299_04522 [Baekduia alba]|uniref:hypothetical protein n=1 Tax=Baekduia alba TaxID=2997333 RepID=UPI002340CB22|nr:hypothetical protein [Baekduia alba]WCB95772.1 hypothetical protein DSM104299_04522 [Baekduia alba]